MESFVLDPIFSTVASVLLILGSYEIGKYFSKKLHVGNHLSKVSNLDFQYCTIGLVILLILLFPLTAFTNYSSIILKITGFILIILGIKFFFSSKNLKISEYFELIELTINLPSSVRESVIIESNVKTSS